MLPFPDTSVPLNAKDLCSNPKSIVSNINFFENAALFIISISLLLRLFFISYNDLLVEEAYYWNYAKHLDLSYLDHPPMVAVLIKLTTSLFGTHEFSVRIASLLCWLLTAFYSFKLTQLITRGTGLYAVLLLAILPFFFLHSLVMTPDAPLIGCWSATIYCLYRALVLDEPQYWYTAGLWLGLGLLSKYTIVLLGPATLLYLCIVPTARRWLTRREPYLAVLITTLFFTPVIYWNATHEWVSFVFQSTRRLESGHLFSFHHLLGLLMFFLMPPGIVSFWRLFHPNSIDTLPVEIKTKRFLQVFTLVPLAVFATFSMSHEIRFNWIGPALLPIIPWLARLIKDAKLTRALNIRLCWLITALLLLVFYSYSLFVISFGTPKATYQRLFVKYIAWSDLTRQIHTIAKNIEAKTHTTPIIVPLDLYNINSELSFYQAKFLANGDIQKSYPTLGRHIFGGDSLMYKYWAKETNLAGKTLIILSKELDNFYYTVIRSHVIEKSPLLTLWAHSPLRGAQTTPYYYQMVELRPYK